MRAFLNAASPGVVAVFQANEYYPDKDAYIEAVAEALRPEYEAIVAAGFDQQIDPPDLAMSRHLVYADLAEEDFIRVVECNVAALNHATRNIPAQRMRMHIYWGNYPGPHHFDIPFERIASRAMAARPRTFPIEGANSRHGHEWAVFRDISLADDKILAPGVIDSTSNGVEHPELVAQRLLRYADVVGRERVIAGSDCGFSTFSGFPTVFPDIVWLMHLWSRARPWRASSFGEGRIGWNARCPSPRRRRRISGRAPELANCGCSAAPTAPPHTFRRARSVPFATRMRWRCSRRADAGVYTAM